MQINRHNAQLFIKIKQIFDKSVPRIGIFWLLNRS